MLVREVDDPAALARVAELAKAVRPLPVDLLRELTVAGGSLVAAAVEDDAIVGASVGFLSPVGLHSYVTVVDPAARRQGVATALKWHQREWALAAGLSTVVWTFDPTDVACARLTVGLGAEITSYQRSFAADGTDRVVATWALRSARVTGVWHGVPPEPEEPDHRFPAGAELATALDAGCHVVGVDDDGTWLLRGPG